MSSNKKIATDPTGQGGEDGKDKKSPGKSEQDNSTKTKFDQLRVTMRKAIAKATISAKTWDRSRMLNHFYSHRYMVTTYAPHCIVGSYLTESVCS